MKSVNKKSTEDFDEKSLNLVLKDVETDPNRRSMKLHTEIPNTYLVGNDDVSPKKDNHQFMYFSGGKTIFDFRPNLRN